MRRVVVIGTSGAGKTSFAAELSRRLNVPHTQLDALYWGANWTPREDFQDEVIAAVSEDEWIIDGNYSKVRHLTWPQADTIIWLDYSLPTILQRLMRRTARRCLTRERLWADNRERTLVQLFRRDSIFRWCVSSFARHRREYPELLMKAARRGTYIVRFRSPRQARQWLFDLLAVEKTIASTQLESNPSP